MFMNYWMLTTTDRLLRNITIKKFFNIRCIDRGRHDHEADIFILHMEISVELHQHLDRDTISMSLIDHEDIRTVSVNLSFEFESIGVIGYIRDFFRAISRTSSIPYFSRWIIKSGYIIDCLS